MVDCQWHCNAKHVWRMVLPSDHSTFQKVGKSKKKNPSIPLGHRVLLLVLAQSNSQLIAIVISVTPMGEKSRYICYITNSKEEVDNWSKLFKLSITDVTEDKMTDSMP